MPDAQVKPSDPHLDKTVAEINKAKVKRKPGRPRKILPDDPTMQLSQLAHNKSLSKRQLKASSSYEIPEPLSDATEDPFFQVCNDLPLP